MHPLGGVVASLSVLPGGANTLYPPTHTRSILASAQEQMGSFMKSGTRRLRRAPNSATGSKLSASGSGTKRPHSLGHRGSITRLNLHEAGAQFYTMEQL